MARIVKYSDLAKECNLPDFKGVKRDYRKKGKKQEKKRAKK